MLHIATITMDNGVQNVPQALMGARATVDTADAARVQLDVAAGDVAGYVRQGDDLVIQLKNGEVIVLSDYFDGGAQNAPSLETLDSAGNYASVDFGASAAANGVLTPSIGGAAAAAAESAGLAGTLGGMGMAGIAGLGALAVGGVAAVAAGGGSGDGGGSGGGTGAYVPKPEVGQYNADTMSGTGTPGDTITIKDTKTGAVLGTTTVGPDGKWSLSLDPKPADGDQVSVTGTDKDGNVSQTSSVTIGESRPAAPEVTHFSPDEISGTGTPGDTVTITDPTTGQVLGQGTVGPDGTWSITPNPKPTPGAQVTVSGSDSSGNDSQSSGVTIGENRPVAPEVNQFTPDEISGTGTPGDTVTITDQSTGQVLGSTTVKPDGTWSITPNPKPAPGAQVTVSGSDANGNDSQSTGVTIGEDRPATPEVTQSGPDTISGTGTPGNTITVTDDTTGQTIGSATVGADGKWSLTPNPKPDNGDHISAVATDKNGNDSQRAEATFTIVDTTPPEAPTNLMLDASSDSGASDSDGITKDTTLMIKGSAEAGATVTVYETHGAELGTAVAGQDGSWSVTTNTLAEGQHSITAKATDAAGNVSTASSPLVVTIDTTAPVAPQATLLNGTTVSGTAEAFATITIDYNGDGAVDKTTVADSQGKWSFDGLTLANGTAVKAWATDAAGNMSEADAETVDTTTPTVRILNPNMTYSVTKISGDTGYNYSAVIGDFDGDGDNDIHVGVAGTTQNIIWKNDGKGVFTEKGNIDGDTAYAWHAVAGDLNNDGRIDLYVPNYGSYTALNGLWHQLPDGKMDNQRITTDTGYSQGAVIADIDGDGDLDIYVANYNGQNRLWINDGSGHFKDESINGDSWNSYGAAVGDFNHDGHMDIYVANYNQQNVIWLNNKSNKFLETKTIDTDVGLSQDAVAGDFDGDGFDDIYVANNGQNILWFQDKDNPGEFIRTILNGDVGDSRAVEAADIDGDGDLDLYVANNGSTNRLWFNNGDRTFSGHDINTDDWYTYDVAIGDVNGDGWLDLYAANYGAQNLLWINDGLKVTAGVDSVSVKSSTQGTVYLVNDSVDVQTLSDITDAADALWNSVAITAEDTATALDTSGLEAGDYYAYAVNAGSTLSLVSEMSIVIIEA